MIKSESKKYQDFSDQEFQERVYSVFVTTELCTNCDHNGDGFKQFEELKTILSLNPVKDFYECPRCKYGQMWF